MPCDSEYLAPNGAEQDSVEAATHIRYIEELLGNPVEAWIIEASEHCYGNRARLNELVVTLCTLCRKMSDREEQDIIYDGRSPQARKLADWWEKHQAADAAREREEAKATETQELAESARAKLTPEEIEALKRDKK